MTKDDLLDFISAIKSNSPFLLSIEIKDVSHDELILIHDAILHNNHIINTNIELTRGKEYLLYHDRMKRSSFLLKEIRDHIGKNRYKLEHDNALIMKR